MPRFRFPGDPGFERVAGTDLDPGMSVGAGPEIDPGFSVEDPGEIQPRGGILSRIATQQQAAAKNSASRPQPTFGSAGWWNSPAGQAAIYKVLAQSQKGRP